ARHPASLRLAAKRLGEILQPGPRVTPQRHICCSATADLLSDDVEMNQRDGFRRQHIALRRNLAELASDHDETVRRLDHLVGDARITAEEPDRKRMCAGD